MKQVGIHDNFFELGGDSIISLQVVARARQAGLALSARQLFQHQTVARARPRWPRSASAAPDEQGPVTGPVPLTPVQRQLLRHDAGARPPLQPVRAAGLARAAGAARCLEKALAHVVAHHDALRLRLRQHEGAWLQDNASPDEAPPTCSRWTSPPRPPPSSPRRSKPRPRACRPASSWPQPPLLRAALFHLGNGQQRLLLVAHHLVIDARLLARPSGGPRVRLSAPGGAARPRAPRSRPGRAACRHAHSEALRSEAPFWLDEARAQVAPLPTDASGPNTYASARSVSVTLDAEETKLLLQEVPSAWRAHINDVLLTALARALSDGRASPSPRPPGRPRPRGALRRRGPLAHRRLVHLLHPRAAARALGRLGG